MIKKEFIFWTWQIGGLPSFHDMSESGAVSLLEYAYTLGIRSFDTAPIYGMWKSEKYLGKAFESVRKDIRIITKFGYSLKWNRSIYDVTPRGIESQLQESLEKLRTDSIDTYLLHIPERIDSVESIVDCLNTLKRKWYIKEYGLSNTSWNLLQTFLAVKNAEISVIQDFYNLLDRSAEQGIFPLLPESTLFMAYSPLYRWGLTDTPLADILKKEEWAINMLFRNQGLKHFMRERKLYEMVAAKRWLSLKEFALNFLIQNTHVSSIIYGTSKKEHLKEIYSTFQKLSA